MRLSTPSTTGQDLRREGEVEAQRGALELDVRHREQLPLRNGQTLRRRRSARLVLLGVKLGVPVTDYQLEISRIIDTQLPLEYRGGDSNTRICMEKVIERLMEDTGLASEFTPHPSSTLINKQSVIWSNLLICRIRKSTSVSSPW